MTTQSEKQPEFRWHRFIALFLPCFAFILFVYFGAGPLCRQLSTPQTAKLVTVAMCLVCGLAVGTIVLVARRIAVKPPTIGIYLLGSFICLSNCAMVWAQLAPGNAVVGSFTWLAAAVLLIAFAVVDGLAGSTGLWTRRIIHLRQRHRRMHGLCEACGAAHPGKIGEPCPACGHVEERF
jgi:hypothetical protein